jgi:hypothetical protein
VAVIRGENRVVGGTVSAGTYESRLEGLDRGFGRENGDCCVGLQGFIGEVLKTGLEKSF